MVFASRLFFSRASQVIMPFPASAGKDLPLSEENNDISILSVRESFSGHEIEETPVAIGFQAHMFESKLDTLTNSMLKMSDSLARLTRPHSALLTSEKEDALKKVDRVNLTPPNVFSRKKLTLNQANFLTRTCSRARRTVVRRSMKVSPNV